MLLASFDLSASCPFRFVWSRLPVASLTIEVLHFLAADELLSHIACVNRTALGIIYGNAFWLRCQTLFLSRLPASSILRALVARCISVRSVVLYTAATLNAAAPASVSVVAARQHACLSVVGTLAPQSLETAQMSPPTIHGSQKNRITNTHHRFWFVFSV